MRRGVDLPLCCCRAGGPEAKAKAKAKPKPKTKQAQGAVGPLGLRVDGLDFTKRMEKLRSSLTHAAASSLHAWPALGGELKKEVNSLNGIKLDLPDTMQEELAEVNTASGKLEALWKQPDPQCVYRTYFPGHQPILGLALGPICRIGIRACLISRRRLAPRTS